MKTSNTFTENNFINESVLNQVNEDGFTIQNENSNYLISEEEFADEERSFAQVEKFIGFVI